METDAHDISVNPVRAPQSAGQTADDPDLDLIAWLAKEHGRPFTKAALRSAIPSDTNLSTPQGVSRALETIGLKSKLVQGHPDKIDPGSLPCVIFRKDASPVILVSIAPRGKRLTIIEPDKGPMETELRRRDARRTFGPDVLLVSKANIRQDGPSGTLQATKPATPWNWFWGPVRESWPSWAQIIVAAFCMNVLSLALPIFVMNVYDRVIPNVAFVTLWTLAIGVGIALLLDLALRTLRLGVLERIGRRVELKAAATLFDQTLNARLLSRPGGAAGMANAVREFDSVRDFFGSASFIAVIDLLFIGVFVAALFFVVGPLAYVPLIAIPVVLILAIIAQAPLRHSAQQAQTLATKRHVVLVESLLGVEAIKSLNGEPVMQREWENAIAASSQIGGRTRFWSGLATNGTQLVQQGVSVGIIVWGVFLVSENTISVGALIAANILAGRVLAPLAAVAQTIFRAHYAHQSMRALNDLMALPRERPGAIESNLEIQHGKLAFKNVTFRYPKAEHPALQDVSFDIEPGEVVALLGRVGSGKTTTGKLMNGLISAEDGNILVDGHGISQYDPAALRDGIGYLTQESELFTGTLRENMVLGAPQASDEAIRLALYQAGMDDFVAANPDGLNVFLGEKGNRLSGGQRQGVALARLLLRKPNVLFLDEPTNAMDQHMETAVIARLRELADGKTTLLFCTHRMSLAKIADRFIVLDQGRKVLDGPRDQVMNTLRDAQSVQLRGQ
ncbi:MAG: type I secretion system permease/ATPase [Paracoccaceae bacterium]